MEFLTQLWLPIVASAAAVWIASAIVWMALPHHKKDYDKLPDEAAFTEAIRALNIPPGNYGYPDFGDKAACNTPEGKERWMKGPVGILNNWKPGMQMARPMILTFLVYLAMSVLIAYIAWLALAAGAASTAGGLVAGAARPRFADIMQVAGAAGVLGYCFSFLPNGIWFQAKPRAMVFCMIDGVAYGLITGAVFGWLWPSGS